MNSMNSKKKAVVMIVEDEQPLLDAIQKKLNKSGFKTIPVNDAERALHILEKREELPDLIWLDYYLPGMSGLDFVSRLKKDDKLSTIPIFVISNTAGPEKVSTLMGLGVDKYFLKAEKRLEEIIEEIQSFL